jgi:glutamate synthase (NADPH/NADH) small chain
VFDENKRFAPAFDESDRIRFEVDMIVESVGQAADMSYVSGNLKDALELTPRRQVKVSEEGQTSIAWLFAGGDIVHGPDAIHGIADGHAAARGIERYLRERAGSDNLV